MNIRVNAYLDNNIGDDLMIKLVAKRFSNYNFILYSDKTIVKNTFRDVNNIEVKTNKYIDKDIDKIDLYLTIGGSVFKIRSLREAFFRIKNIQKIKKMKRKDISIATIGSNLGPYYNNKLIKLSELQIRLNDLTTVRDKDSYKKLNSFKKIKSYYFADDIVYNLKNTMKINKTERNGLGISAYRYMQPDENNYQNYQALAEVANRYINLTNKKVKLFAFDTEKENDLSAAHHIYSMIDSKEYVEIVPYLGDEKKFLNKFESCEVMIAIRFHSAILADIFEIPFLPVVYSNKMQNLLDDREFKGRSVSLEKLTPNLDIREITRDLIEEKNLFKEFIKGNNLSPIHFTELEKLLEKIKIKKSKVKIG